MNLLCCCARDKTFRLFVSLDDLGYVLQPLLSEHGSRGCFLALLSLSFFIDDNTPEQQKQMLKVEMPDIQLVQIHLALKQISLADVLHFMKTSALVSTNVAVLKSSDVQMFVSQFLDDNTSTGEGKLAAEIITILQSVSKESTKVQSPNELLECFLPLLSACNAATASGESSVDLESCIHICQKLQAFQDLLEEDTKEKLQSISKHMLETAVKELSLYVKLHLMGKLVKCILVLN